MKDEFSLRLKEARKKCGYTQKEAAKKTGVTQSSYCDYETGKKKPGFNL